jgi:beta-galactosidase
VTSYDYDALLTEGGDITKKYLAVREVVKKYVAEPLPDIPENRKKKDYGKVYLTKKTGLFEQLENLSIVRKSNVPRCMEYYGFGYGYIAYQTTLNRDYQDVLLAIESLGDRAQIYVNRKIVDILYVNDKLETKITAKAGDTLTILCENMGRANFGAKMMRKKGIAGRCLLGNKIHFNWRVYPLPMDNLQLLDFHANTAEEESAFYKGKFTVDETCDTFLALENFKKGFVTINGFHLGRYWEVGPQKTHYVPASVLKVGENEIIVFVSDGLKGESCVEFFDIPDLG